MTSLPVLLEAADTLGVALVALGDISADLGLSVDDTLPDVVSMLQDTLYRIGRVYGEIGRASCRERV